MRYAIDLNHFREGWAPCRPIFLLVTRIGDDNSDGTEAVPLLKNGTSAVVLGFIVIGCIYSGSKRTPILTTNPFNTPAVVNKVSPRSIIGLRSLAAVVG